MAGEDIETRREAILLELAERILKTIPSIPEDFHELKPEEQDRIFVVIDERATKVSELLNMKQATPRGPVRNPRGPRRSERFNTPALDTEITPRKPRRIVTDGVD